VFLNLHEDARVAEEPKLPGRRPERK
jgi:hypothetical protein